MITAAGAEKEGNMILTEQQKKEKVKDLRPIDDVFFEILAQSIPAYQEMLRTIMEDDSLISQQSGDPIG